MNSVITLTTDFGISDPYVGVMKGVILTINPNAQIIDLTHQIEPQNIVQAAWTIKTVCKYFPKETVHLIVVDPGVGTNRRIIALQTEDEIFLAPDNGILTFIIDEIKNIHAYEIDNPDYYLETISNTFHGRDIFAPVCAHISKGSDLNIMGKQIGLDNLVQLEIKKPYVKGKNILRGSIVSVDHFGNLITNISKILLEDAFWGNVQEQLCIKIGGKEIKGLSPNYQSVKKNDSLAIIGSSGFLEIAINCGSAVFIYQASIGDTIEVYLGRIR